MERRVYVYGFEDLHHVVDCRHLRESQLSIESARRIATSMFERKPSIRRVYVVFDRPGLKEDFLDACIRPHFTKDIEFEDIICREHVYAFAM